MASESGGGQGPPEPTFADVMNGFSFDSGRSGKRRRWSRRQETEQEPEPEAGQPDDQPEQEWSAAPAAAEPNRPVGTGWPEEPTWTPSHQREPEYDPVAGSESTPAAVRPYAWTRGRTRAGMELQLETLVSTSPRGRDQLSLLTFEHRSVAELCEQARSVAEVAALLSVPLGVAKVLVGDMAGVGLVVVHQTQGTNGDVPDLALMERVLSGLRRL